MSNNCVCCGKYVEEGRMVCWFCEKKYLGDNKNNC